MSDPFTWEWVKEVRWQIWAIVLVTIIICIAVRT